MNQQAATRLKRDFRSWSGGFSPESRDQITVYVDYALDRGIDPGEATDMLQNWMASNDPDADLYEESPLPPIVR